VNIWNSILFQYSVLLFDEIEKAHPNVLNILLQILDDGRLTDTKGRTVNFKNTIIIMTSNMAQGDIKKYLRPEFINRIDEIVTFYDLNEEVIRKIVDIQLNKVFKRLAEQNIKLEIDQNVKDYLVKNGYVPEYGARPINRIIKREILAELSKHILEHPEENKLKAVIEDGEIKIRNS
jgi:ATP-dependent Clp protease ATP-binding subunit ClpB